LGQAFLVWSNGRYEVVASEGGHADFAPRCEVEIELLRFLIDRYGRVSYERVLSGPGLANIYAFFKRREPEGETAELRAALAQAEDPAPVISDFGLSGRDPLAQQALDLLVAVYGAEAGNLALKVAATGGVYVTGGIAPRIRTKLVQGVFSAAYRDKGRLSDLVASIPVELVLNTEVGLLGAAQVAARD
jgi:glucokinase